jgi:ABC-2 type transport system permease protein
MSEKTAVDGGRTESRGSASPTWWLVFARETRDLWLGGKALYLTLFYTVLLGVYAYVMAKDSLLSLIPPQEMTFELLKVAMAASVFIGVILGADSLSGERERATLEGLLLTPTSRTQIVVGKFMAAMSAWPVALAISIPYMFVLSQGDEVFGLAVLWGAALGSALMPAFTALGMLVSFWCNTNKTSMFVSLGLYLLFLLPTQLPGRAQTGALGALVQWANPLAATSHFLARTLVNNRRVDESWPGIATPVTFAVLTVAMLILYAGPALRLEGGRARRTRAYRASTAGLPVVACLTLFLGSLPVAALPQELPKAAEVAQAQPSPPLGISIDLDTSVVNAGTPVLYSTQVTNHGAETSRPLILAMNIINLDAKGEIVDPEDWSPQRTQYLDSLAPGQSAKHSWRVNAILDGDFMVYMVAIPEPNGTDATSHPVASSGIHLTVKPFTKLNPAGVLPYAVGGPVLLALVIYLALRHRRRGIDMGDENAAG